MNSIKYTPKFFILIALLFSIAVAISMYFYQPQQLLSRSAKNIQTTINQDFKNAKLFLADTLIQNIFLSQSPKANKSSWVALNRLAESKKAIAIVYHKNRLKYWTSNALGFSENELKTLPNFSFKKYKNAYYIIFKEIKLANTMLFVLPIKSSFAYQNEYLQNKFDAHLNVPEYILLNQANASDFINILDLNGAKLFQVSMDLNKLGAQHFYTRACLEILAIIFTLLALAVYLVLLAKRKSNLIALLTLLACLLAIRTATYYFKLPAETFRLPIFNPNLFASNFIFPSLGDLAFNLILIFVLVWFISKIFIHQKKINTIGSLLLLYLAVLILSYGLLALIQALVLDSSISFDFFNIETLTIYSLMGLAIISLACYILYLGLFTLAAIVDQNFLRMQSKFAGLLLLILLSVAYFLSSTLLVIALLSFGVLFILFKSKFSIRNHFTVAAILLIISLFVIQSVYLLSINIESKEIQNRELLVAKLEMANDPIAEYLLDSILIKASKDAIITSQLAKAQPNTALVIEKLNANYLNGYFSKYSRTGNVFFLNNKKDREKYEQLDSFINKNCELTSNQGLFFLTNNYGQLNYFAKIKYSINNSTVWVVMAINANYFREDNIYPELFLEGNLRINKDFNQYAYAIYKSNKLISQKGDYPYKTKPNDFLANNNTSLVVNGYKHLVYRPNQDVVIVVSKAKNSLVNYISFFAYVFLIFLVLFLAIYLICILLNKQQVQFTFSAITNRLQLLFKTRVQLSLLFTIIISITIMGVVTYQYISNLNTSQQEEILSKNLHAIQQVIIKKVGKQAIAKSVHQDDFVQAFQQVADLYQRDINLYALNGDLLLSTRPMLTQSGITANCMNPSAYISLSLDAQSEIINKEKVGNLNYLSAYTPIRNSNSEVIAYLNLPYFANAADYNQKIAVFITTIINSYVLIVFFISIIAYFIAKSITAPLSLIQDQLINTKLGQKMKTINWNRNDEIGSLIKAYNKMIIDLEESANKLAKSERESAWKEMAKQVAHEIKNPLTPMKLGLQLLERAHQAQDKNFTQKFENFAKTFIQQIDNLTNIANEFANYAQMPNHKTEAVVIKDALWASLDLFKHLANVKFTINDETPHELKVLGNKDNFISIFNNLFRNAIQAVDQIEHPIIQLHLSISSNKLLIKFEDNGVGIPESIQANIFEPSFTTKNSGMGLGLAIVKNNLLPVDGEIWFESSANKGTTFFVLLPIVN
jgi:signal transduction histidine kinase